MSDELAMFKKRQTILMKHIGKLVRINEENVSMLLEMQGEDLIKLLKMKRDSVYEDLPNLNDGEYISRQKLLHTLDEVIELLKEHEND